MVAISYSLTLLKNVEFDLNRIVVHCLLVEILHTCTTMLCEPQPGITCSCKAAVVISHVFCMFVESLTTDTPYVATTSASSELLQDLRL